MPIKSLLKSIVGVKMTKVTKVRIGTVDPAKDAHLDKLRADHDAEHDRVEAEIKAFIKKMKAEHGPSCKRFKEETHQTWESIFDDLGISQEDRAEEYSIDGNGVIYRHDEELIAGDPEDGGIFH
ncbi:hypothetical protein [Sporosarcina sp. FSL K6-1508]|uniref:hypothetical protein n=1 Tax=Sporosarcina sp. FSL K6-1508 TaxID=2921553 RepID=UPI0030FC42A4